MPLRTRADMHIGLDLALELLDATPMNRLDPPVKDYFLNATISKFVTNIVSLGNKAKAPSRILTYDDIITKYNAIYTLIKTDDSLLPVMPLSDNSFYLYILPTDLFRFETSYSNVRSLNCIYYTDAAAPTLALPITPIAGNVNTGKHYYFVTFMYDALETDTNGVNIASITIALQSTNGKVELTNIPLGGTACTKRKIYRTKVGEPWYLGKLLTTLNDNTTTVFTDNIADSALGVVYSGNNHDVVIPNNLVQTYDIMSFNSNPFAGGRKLIGTIVDTNGLKLYHLNRYAIGKVGIIYIKKPAILTSSPSVVNCDLPDSVHDRIVDETAEFIAASTTSGNYEQLLMEAKKQNQ